MRGCLICLYKFDRISSTGDQALDYTGQLMQR